MPLSGTKIFTHSKFVTCLSVYINDLYLINYCRYPDDPYDRRWNPRDFGNASIRVSSDALFSKLTSAQDRPPPAVLKNAITATRTNERIHLLMELPSYEEINVYINLYFSEVTRLQPKQNRSFRIFKDNKSISDPIVPPYGDCVEMGVKETMASSKTTFSLVPTNVSTLPPLINAMEIFQIGDSPLTGGTNKKDGKISAYKHVSATLVRSSIFDSECPFCLSPFAD